MQGPLPTATVLLACVFTVIPTARICDMAEYRTEGLLGLIRCKSVFSQYWCSWHQMAYK
jgi:hypothetical protein